MCSCPCTKLTPPQLSTFRFARTFRATSPGRQGGPWARLLRGSMRSAIFLTLTLFGLAWVLPVKAQINSGTWAATGSLNTGRGGHTATLLNNGVVLVVGGSDSGGNALASAELYNSTTGTFAATGNLNALRLWHSAAALPNGMVLVAGGYCVNGSNVVPVTTAELYDPVAGRFINTGSLVAAAR